MFHQTGFSFEKNELNSNKIMICLKQIQKFEHESESSSWYVLRSISSQVAIRLLHKRIILLYYYHSILKKY